MGDLIGGVGCGVERVVVVDRAHAPGEGGIGPPLTRVAGLGFGKQRVVGLVFGCIGTSLDGETQG